MASRKNLKTERPCLRQVMTAVQARSHHLSPVSPRVPCVTLRSITQCRSARSATLLVGSTDKVSKTVNTLSDTQQLVGCLLLHSFRFTLTLLLAPLTQIPCAWALPPVSPPPLGSFPCAAQDAGRANLATTEQATA